MNQNNLANKAFIIFAFRDKLYHFVVVNKSYLVPFITLIMKNSKYYSLLQFPFLKFQYPYQGLNSSKGMEAEEEIKLTLGATQSRLFLQR